MGDGLETHQRSYHFIGIGGVGMSALAYILAEQGYQVSGSDLAPNGRTRRLQSLGVEFCQGHSAENLTGDPRIVYSSAIRPNNPEIAAAVAKGLLLYHRADLLAELFQGHHSIGVAGTHGKTTTSSMIGYLLLAAGMDPTVIIGGEVDAWGGNARLGTGRYLVAEVDESDGSLIRLYPTVGIITNIELDHPDHYADLDQVISTFQHYAQQCQLLVASLDCPNVAAHLSVDVGYSLNEESQAAYVAREVRYLPHGTQAQVWEHGQYLGDLTLRLLGSHNLSNALATVAVGRHLGMEFSIIAAALAEFVGAHRRFELKGQVGDVLFIDDYAHHPSEIQATLAAASLQERRIVAVFQPHRPSRLASLFEDFTHAFAQADCVVVTPVYTAGEPDQLQASSVKLAAALAQVHPQVYYEPTLANLPTALAARLQPADLVLFLGAGDLNQSISATIKAYSHHAALTNQGGVGSNLSAPVMDDAEVLVS